MNNIEKDIYLELLCASLWEHDVDISLFKDKWSWKVLLDAFMKNDLLGIVANTVITLPENVKPQMQEMAVIYNYLGNLLQNHNKLNRRLAHIMPRLEKVGCHPVLLKGQGLSVLYPKSCIRSCGDLDIYVGTAGIVLAKAVVNSMATEEELNNANEHSLHYHIDLDGVTYEIHQASGNGANKKYCHNYMTISNKYLLPDKLEKVSLPISNDEYATVNVPSVDFNVWFIFDHLMRHYRNGGVGLRQLIDWMMVIHEWNKRCNNERKFYILKDILKKIGLLRAWKIMGGILVYQLGLPENEFPLFDARMAKKSQGFMNDELIDGSRFSFGFKEKLGEPWHGYKRILYNLNACYYSFRPYFVFSPYTPYINFLKYVFQRVCFHLKIRKD